MKLHTFFYFIIDSCKIVIYSVIRLEPKLNTANFISCTTKLNDKVGLELMVVSSG